MEGEEDGDVSASSSPPTPPSPLPISIGPGNQRYHFSPSPSPSPPFSPNPSSHLSSENLPLLQSSSPPSQQQRPAAFSLDHKQVDDDSNTSCLKDLLEWLIQRCCNCCIN